jgi:hypothetical protein
LAGQQEEVKGGTYDEKDREKDDQVGKEEKNCEAIGGVGLRRVLSQALDQRAAEGDGRVHGFKK